MIHVHGYTAFANNYGTFPERAVTSLHKGAYLRGKIIASSFLAPVECLEWVYALFLVCENGAAEAGQCDIRERSLGHSQKTRRGPSRIAREGRT